MSDSAIEWDRFEARIEARMMRIYLPSFVKSGTPWILRCLAPRTDRAVDGPPACIATAVASCSTKNERQMVLSWGCKQ